MSLSRLVCLFLPLMFFVFCEGQVSAISISSGWRFHSKGEVRWYPAKVPGEVHTDLMANKLIPDPFYRDNETKLRWIETKDFEYETVFSVPTALLDRRYLELVFDGLDTYASVYLNDRLVLSADNMFRQWKVEVKGLVKPAGNRLRILFRSAQNMVDSIAKAALPYVIPDNSRCYVRKAQFHFGWDWGPKFTTCGIWRPARLECYDIKSTEPEYTPPVKVELIQKPDEHGTSFYFMINGQPVYMKGANYIPSDAFVTRMTRDEYRRMLMMAKNANMNMLRVWGGGIYEDDYFYDLCDSLGIYVWQDFMFAGTMVPGSDAFFANVREEVRYQVSRLRRHKSIVLWCGNNESDEAFFRWGWHRSFHISKADSVRLWKDYTRLFHDSLPAWLGELDNSRPYITTSPRYGWGVPESLTEGDSHYWGTWWGGEDFEVFEKKTGRFVSEYGMLAMPNYSSVLAITQAGDRYLFSDVLQTHMKAGNGFRKLNAYLKNYMIDSAKIEKLSVADYVYLTQCVQYFGFKNMILIQRSKEPYNMGTLLWQLNDCWPVASWSITDYYHRNPKAAWYAVKEAYRDDKRPGRDTIRPKDMKLSDPSISYRVEGNAIVFRSKAFARFVYVDLQGYDGALSENYFDLEPWVEKRVIFDKAGFHNSGPLHIQVKSLFDVVSK